MIVYFQNTHYAENNWELFGTWTTLLFCLTKPG